MISFGAWKKPFSTRRFQNHWNGRKEKIRTHSDLEMSSDELFLAPQVGLEPTTLRLTAECSAIELLRNITSKERDDYTAALRFCQPLFYNFFRTKLKDAENTPDKRRVRVVRFSIASIAVAPMSS